MNVQDIRTSSLFNHIVAFVVISIWGTTFVSTKILLIEGLTASQIMVYRFIIAYLLMLPMAKRFRSDSIGDEIKLILAGICGGSLYFYPENTALKYTLVTNVALILCFTPIITLVLSHIFLRSVEITRTVIIGSLVAIFGVSMVIFNGSYILKLSPMGDLLTFVSALSWGFYSVLLKKLDGKYSISFITRKVFFYGVLTLLPITISQGKVFDVDVIFKPQVIGNLLFLSVVASLICFLAWNRAVKVLGTATTSSYMYVSPLAALWVSHLVLDEPVTIVALLGAAFILSGVCYVERGDRIFSDISALFKRG